MSHNPVKSIIINLYSAVVKRINLSILPTNFVRFTIGQFLSIIGSEVFTFGLGVWIFSKTGQATDLVLSYLFAILPRTLLSPFIGVWVDRFNRIGVAITSDVINAVAGVFLVFFIGVYGFHIWVIYLIISIRGFLGAVQTAATSGLTVDLVPAEKLTRANSFRSVLGEISRIIAPLLGAFIFIRFGIKTAILIDIISFVVCALLIIGLKNEAGKVAKSAVNTQSYFEMIKEGYKFLKFEKVILKTVIVSMSIAIPFQFCSVIFLPLMLSASGSNAYVISAFEIAFSIGAIISGLLLLWVNPSKQIKQKEYFFAILLSVPILIFSISSSTTLWCIAAFVWASVGSAMCVVGDTWMQKRVESRFIGRVNSTISAISGFTSIIPFLLAGFMADHVFGPLVDSNSSFVVVLRNATGLGFDSGYMLMCFVFGITYLFLSVGGFIWIRLNQGRFRLD
ncbi:MAG TPA: MFS transporter [Caldisericia bacterium]|nr:MFS transporter [Caldisericia bacterium]HPF48894.1 MFS transporter [Caldisericia bacterium]HPI83242.1 MFS transporter [Caldisericia bacterium]HPQ92469.1 MFS transporter [Caldisericia bacterium]HRV74433.1 MFS transporter [Caldisericia bacterium]